MHAISVIRTQQMATNVLRRTRFNMLDNVETQFIEQNCINFKVFSFCKYFDKTFTQQSLLTKLANKRSIVQYESNLAEIAGLNPFMTLVEKWSLFLRKKKIVGSRR